MRPTDRVEPVADRGDAMVVARGRAAAAAAPPGIGRGIVLLDGREPHCAGAPDGLPFSVTPRKRGGRRPTT